MKRILNHSWLALAVLACATAAVPAHAGAANLLANPGFEDVAPPYNGWFVFGSGPDTSNQIVQTGVTAAKFAGEFMGPWEVGGASQRFDITPVANTQYTFSGSAFMPSFDPLLGFNSCSFNRFFAKIVYINASGQEILSNELVIADFGTVQDQWFDWSFSSPVPSGADSVRALLLYIQADPTDPGTVFVDDVSFYEEPIPALPNLLTNGSWTLGMSGWTVFGNAYVEVGTGLVRSAPGSGKMFGAFGQPGQATVMQQGFPGTPGMDYVANLHTFVNCADGLTASSNFSLAAIKFLSGGVLIDSAQVVIADSSSKAFQWTEYDLVANAPATTDSVIFQLLFIQPLPFEGGAVFYDDVSFYEMTPVSVDLTPRELNFSLRQNAPNPFVANTRIDFTLQHRDVVDISVYDITGRRVANLMNQALPAGRHSVKWDGRMSNGVAAGTGIYRYVMQTSAGSRSRSMTLIR